MSLNFTDRRVATDYQLAEEEQDRDDGFILTPSWVGVGDSYISGFNGETYANDLAELTGTSIINAGFGGGEMNVMTAAGQFTNNFIKNPAYKNLSSIINYGVNDWLNFFNHQLPDSAAQWRNCYLSGILNASLPQNKIIDARTFPIKVGDWLNAIVGDPALQFGVYSKTINSYVETQATGRYYAFSFLIVNAPTLDATWRMLIDGVIVSDFAAKFRTVANTANGFYMQTVVVDMETVATRTVRVINISATSDDARFFNYLAAWDGTEADRRNVLCVAPPMIDFASRSDPNANVTRYLSVVDGIKKMVLQAQQLDLPVYLHDLSNFQINNWFGDLLHLTGTGCRKVAKDILLRSIKNY